VGRDRVIVAQRSHGGSDREEFRRMSTPLMRQRQQLHADNPLASSCSASACIRLIASSRASYSASVNWGISTFCPMLPIVCQNRWCAT